MKVWYSQIYLDPDVDFPFSCYFQKWLSNAISELVTPSDKYISMYGYDYDIIFRISAKKCTDSNEILGPTVFKSTKHVEYSVFLPYDKINKTVNSTMAALSHIFCGTYIILEKLDIDTTRIKKREIDIVNSIFSDQLMFE